MILQLKLHLAGSVSSMLFTDQKSVTGAKIVGQVLSVRTVTATTQRPTDLRRGIRKRLRWRSSRHQFRASNWRA